MLPLMPEPIAQGDKGARPAQPPRRRKERKGGQRQLRPPSHISGEMTHAREKIAQQQGIRAVAMVPRLHRIHLRGRQVETPAETLDRHATQCPPEAISAILTLATRL